MSRQRDMQLDSVPQEIALGFRGRSGRGRLWKALTRFVRNQPLGAIGGFVCLFLIVVALAAPAIATHPPKVIIGEIFEDPTFTQGLNNWGTDHLGRDVFSRIVWGAQISLLVGFSATFLGVTSGFVWGIVQGYWGGSLFDTSSQRILEAILAIPALILAMTFIAVLGPSVLNVIVAIAIRYLATAARTVRSTTLSIRENVYIDAARAIGASPWRIIFLHVMPNTFAIYLILLSLHIGGAIIAEASLSFLGVGVPVNQPSWGSMVTQGTRQALLGGIPWLAIFPGIAIAMVVYAFNLLGDALRDTLDPRLRGSRSA